MFSSHSPTYSLRLSSPRAVKKVIMKTLAMKVTLCNWPRLTSGVSKLLMLLFIFESSDVIPESVSVTLLTENILEARLDPQFSLKKIGR